MIDLRGVPAPDDSPPPGACLRVERPEPALAVVVLEPPHRKTTVFDAPLLRDLDAVLDELETSPELRGVVLTGRDPLHFATGIDLALLEGKLEAERIEPLVRAGQRIADRLEGLRARGIRTVAAVGGAVTSGAYELALCCGRIVLADDALSSVALPETRFGLLPAWGGCRRLPRRLGVSAALEAILSARSFTAREAYAGGLVDRLTPPESLGRVAREVALGRRPCPARGRSELRRWTLDRNPLALAWIGWRARREVVRVGGPDLAPRLALRRVVPALLEPAQRARRGEVGVLATLALDAACANRIRLHAIEERVPELGRRRDGTVPPRLERAVVLGAGARGSVIASALAGAGIATRLCDPSPAALDAALCAHRARIARRGWLDEYEAQSAIDRLDVTERPVGFAHAQLAIEAVPERLDAKCAALAALAGLLPPGALLASCISTLSLAAITSELPHPERVVGLRMHRSPSNAGGALVELVRSERTGDEALTAAAALALRLGATPLVVTDTPGGLIDRLRALYLDEALRLYAGGLSPERLERALRDFGFPLGPLRLLDELGLDTFARAASALHAAYGERMRPCRVLEPLLDAGHLGRKSGDGFHVHLQWLPDAEPRFSSDVARLSPPTSSHEEFLDDEEIVDRLLLPVVSEAARCLDEGVVPRADDVDLATVVALGFPRARGGLLRWATSGSPRALLERLRHGASAVTTGPKPERRARYEPAERLRALAESGRGFATGG